MHKKHPTSSLMVGLIGVALIGLVGLTGYYLYKQSKIAVDKMIANDVDLLRKTLTVIDETCGITNISYDRSHIDFLSIEKFSDNKVGPLELKYPEKWQGPYHEKNPSIQGKVYELVKVKNGYVIAPGKDVKLANGKVMGKDIVIDASTDIDPYLTEEEGLVFQGRPLIAKLELRITRIPPAIIVSD